MPLRVAMGRSDDSPLRILGPGTNPSNPGIEDVLFDANYGTLRKLQSGVISNINSKPIVIFSASTAVGQPSYTCRLGAQVPLADAPPSGKRLYALGLGRLVNQSAGIRFTPFQHDGDGDEKKAEGFAVFTTGSHVGAGNYTSDFQSGTTTTPRRANVYYLVLRNIIG